MPPAGPSACPVCVSWSSDPSITYAVTGSSDYGKWGRERVVVVLSGPGPCYGVTSAQSTVACRPALSREALSKPCLCSSWQLPTHLDPTEAELRKGGRGPAHRRLWAGEAESATRPVVRPIRPDEAWLPRWGGQTPSLRVSRTEAGKGEGDVDGTSLCTHEVRVEGLHVGVTGRAARQGPDLGLVLERGSHLQGIKGIIRSNFRD